MLTPLQTGVKVTADAREDGTYFRSLNNADLFLFNL
jgi:hypothetical protein